MPMKIVSQGILTRWLPKDPAIIRRYHKSLCRELISTGVFHHEGVVEDKQLSLVILEFKKLIEEDPEIFRNFNEMFDQVSPSYKADPSESITTYMGLLAVLDRTISVAPTYSADLPLTSGVPMYGILAPFCDTEAGYRAFTNAKVNAIIRKIFDEWSRFLVSPDSRKVLTSKEGTNGWFTPEALGAQEARLGAKFEDVWVCDTTRDDRGFTSWDDFFVRRFQPRVRAPVDPSDNKFINSPCEAVTWRYAIDVDAKATFWIKEQPYSLDHVLNYDPLASQLVGGKVFQAILSSMDYHRWHSPVNGRVVKAYVVPGSYYAAIVGGTQYDPQGNPIDIVSSSISYQSAVCTRAYIWIESDDPAIGLMCFVGVGLVEVSTTELAVKAGDRVEKGTKIGNMMGTEIGSFHFGGSTYLMVFRPETQLTLLEDLPQIPDPGQKAVRVGTQLFSVDN